MRFSGWTTPLSSVSAMVARRRARRALDRAGAAELNGDWAKAIDYCTHAIGSGGLSDDSLYHAFRTRGQCHAELGRYELAIADLDAVIRIGPDRFAGYTERARIHAECGNHEAAVADWTTALSMRPNYGYILRQRAMSLRRLGRHEEARADIEQASALGPDLEDPLAALGMSAASPEERRRALSELNQTMRRYPDSGWKHAQRGRLHEARGAIGQAIVDYATAIHLQADEARRLRDRGLKLKRKGSHESARTHLEEAVALTASADELAKRLEWIQGPS